MSKTIIEVKCTDQVLTLTNTPVIASGGVGEDYVSIEFCHMWEGYAPTVLFWRKGVDPIPVVEDEEGLFQVPPQLMTTDGVVYFGAVGVLPGGNTRTSEAVSYRLEAGAINGNTILPSPDGAVFFQLMSYYANMKQYVTEHIDEVAERASDAATWAADARIFAKESAESATAAKNSIKTIIYPGVVEAVLNDGNNCMKVPLESRPADKMFLTFRAPSLDGTNYDHLHFGYIYVTYPGDDGTETKESFSVETGYGEENSGNAIAPGDIVTVLLVRVPKNTGINWCYPLSSRINQATLDEMGQRLHPGIPASETTDGTMTVSLDYVPEDKMVLVFTADEASSQVTKFQLQYETIEDGLVQVEYSLWDAKDSPVQAYGFYQGDYVVTLLTPADKRATVLNPRVTRDTMNLIQGIFDNLPEATVTGGSEVITYVGDGTTSLNLVFSKSPKVIQIESLGAGGYSVSAILSRDEKVAKVKVFSDGNYYENVVTFNAAWDKLVVLLFTDYGITPSQLNFNGVTYKAIGYM